MKTVCYTAALTLLVFAVASVPAARAGPIIPWDRMTECSLALNGVAQRLARDVLGASRQLPPKTSASAVLIEPCELCSPANLTADSRPCLQKIAVALHNYTRMFGKEGLFEGSTWEDLAHEAAKMASELRELLHSRVLHTGSLDSQESQSSAHVEPLVNESDRWMLDDLRRHSAERLLSFSILAARVFAAGDPATHGTA
uniref:Interleukin-23 subunit p19 n=2 Tax=Scleropages formosus TaxID=113540 RepID=A0A8C9SDN9_SCLFO